MNGIIGDIAKDEERTFHIVENLLLSSRSVTMMEALEDIAHLYT